MSDTLSAEILEICHQAAVLKNKQAFRLISEWLWNAGHERGERFPQETAKAMWAGMKAHRRYLRSVGAYPVRKAKDAAAP